MGGATQLFGVLILVTGFSSPAQALSYDCMSQAEIPQAECTALVDLYNATAGDSWHDNTGWGTGLPSSWTGVVVESGG